VLIAMSDLPPQLIDRFTQALRASIEEAGADGILLSGGLDTSTIAAYATQVRALSAVTVCVPSNQPIDAAHKQTLASKLGCDAGAFPSPDAAYAQQCAAWLNLTHEIWWLSLDELLTYAPATIRAIRSFDPMQVRNGITIYCGLLRAKSLGLRRVYTGDGADELYAGYSHMWAMAPDQLHAYVRHMATIMAFTTPDLAAAVGIETFSPFTEPDLVDLALELPYEAFIGEREGRVMGKWIIRQAVSALLPGDLVWRVKTPIEYGSGSTFLGPLLQSRISDEEFFSECETIAATTGLRLREKEQLYYYRLYAEQFGPIVVADRGADDCPYCGHAVRPANRNYCGVCGAWGFAQVDNR
jgi:asparagine synthase (glutamine-hydrolysing)